MFTGFFYELRRCGVPVTPTEWLALQEALDRGLAGASLLSFYYLARAVLVKSEAHYDRFDQAFASYFEQVQTSPELAERVARWLQNALPPLKVDRQNRPPWYDFSLEELQRRLAERLQQQKEEHHGGSHWIGTGGTSPFGHSGYNPAGVRIGGESGNRSAVKVAGERRYRDFRQDETLHTRQFELALRRLRRLSSRVDGPKDVLDVEETVRETCRQAGFLSLVWERERRNTIKVVMLMDSGGSMNPHARLCSRLFTAASRATHFKDLKTYFFHNCVYDKLFLDPLCLVKNSVKTLDVLRTLSPDYRLIIVGDASMAPSELLMEGGALDWSAAANEKGIVWLERLAAHFTHAVWLNPLPRRLWPGDDAYDTITLIRRIFPMFELTLEGLEAAVRRLKVAR
ncbi:MAG: vWA domain-containing protein [Bacillota bacterium]